MIPEWVMWAALPLGAWRLAILLSQEGGPFGMFRRIRTSMGFQHDENGFVASWPNRFPATLFSCIWCLSFWTTLVLCLILVLAPWVVVVLGAWGAATYLEAKR